MSEANRGTGDDSEPVPKLPRGRGLKFSGPELFRIAITIALLVAVVVLTKPCSHAVSTFVMGFDGSAAGSAKPPVVNNGFGSAQLIPLHGLTDDQVKRPSSARNTGATQVRTQPRARRSARRVPRRNTDARFAVSVRETCGGSSRRSCSAAASRAPVR